MKIMKASNYFALLPPGSSEALAERDCQGFICACMCVSFVTRQAPEACQPRQGGSNHGFWQIPAAALTFWLCTCRRWEGGEPGREPQPLRGVSSSGTHRYAPGCSGRAHMGTTSHLVTLGWLFPVSNTLCFPGTKPKAADPAKHLSRGLCKVIFRT